MWFDRAGKPMSMEAWDASQEKDRCVAETTLPDGKWISTVWLGLNHNYGNGPPLIFETMVFPSKGNFNDLDCERYASESEALEGHQRMVEKYTKGD